MKLLVVWDCGGNIIWNYSSLKIMVETSHETLSSLKIVVETSYETISSLKIVVEHCMNY